VTDTVIENEESVTFGGRPLGVLEFRYVAEDIVVKFPQRVISLYAVPYESETARAGANGRLINESFARGAFNKVERRTSEIKVVRDHDVRRPVGKALALNPYDEHGLYADLMISDTPRGTETLQLAADGVLGASVGFLPMPGGEMWTEGRSRRRITQAWLGHIAMVSDPAYDGTDALEVRQAGDEGARTGTPMKDEVVARLRQLGFEVSSSLLH